MSDSVLLSIVAAVTTILVAWIRRHDTPPLPAELKAAAAPHSLEAGGGPV